MSEPNDLQPTVDPEQYQAFLAWQAAQAASAVSSSASLPSVPPPVPIAETAPAPEPSPVTPPITVPSEPASVSVLVPAADVQAAETLVSDVKGAITWLLNRVGLMSEFQQHQETQAQEAKSSDTAG